MPKEYDAETKAKAVRLVRDHREDYASEYEAIRTVGGRLGMNPETLRKWLRQAAVDAGQAERTTTAAAREIRELKRKNAELEQGALVQHQPVDASPRPDPTCRGRDQLLR